MKQFNRYSIQLIAMFAAAFILSACGSSSSDMPASKKGSLSLALADAPIDGASKVVVKFTGVEIKPKSGSSISYDFAEVQIDLLELQDGKSILVLDNVEIESGEYTWIRLKVIAEKGVEDSYIEQTDGIIVPLWIPSGSESGLKLNHSFVVPVAGSADFTIDFDLRKSITDPAGQTDYILKPSLRIVDNNHVGEISGTVAEELLSSIDSTSGIETCSETSAVYIFDDIALDLVDDLDGTDPDPITIADVTMDQSGTYSYNAAFLSTGTYTIAFTCHAANDGAEDDDVGIVFLGAASETVTEDTTTIHNFDVSTTP